MNTKLKYLFIGGIVDGEIKQTDGRNVHIEHAHDHEGAVIGSWTYVKRHVAGHAVYVEESMDELDAQKKLILGYKAKYEARDQTLGEFFRSCYVVIVKCPINGGMLSFRYGKGKQCEITRSGEIEFQNGETYRMSTPFQIQPLPPVFNKIDQAA